MPFDPEFLAQMTTTVSITPASSRDAYAKTTWGTPVAVPCHITYRTRLVRRVDTEDVQTVADIQIPPAGYVTPAAVTVPLVTTQHRITFPDGTVHPVETIATYTDETGDHHQTIGVS